MGHRVYSSAPLPRFRFTRSSWTSLHPKIIRISSKLESPPHMSRREKAGIHLLSDGEPSGYNAPPKTIDVSLVVQLTGEILLSKAYLEAEISLAEQFDKTLSKQFVVEIATIEDLQFHLVPKRRCLSQRRRKRRKFLRSQTGHTSTKLDESLKRRGTEGCPGAQMIAVLQVPVGASWHASRFR